MTRYFNQKSSLKKKRSFFYEYVLFPCFFLISSSLIATDASIYLVDEIDRVINRKSEIIGDQYYERVVDEDPLMPFGAARSSNSAKHFFNDAYRQRIEQFWSLVDIHVEILREQVSIEFTRQERQIGASLDPVGKDYGAAAELLGKIYWGMDMIEDQKVLPPTSKAETEAAAICRDYMNHLPLEQRFVPPVGATIVENAVFTHKWNIVFENSELGPLDGEDDFEWLHREMQDFKRVPWGLKQAMAYYPVYWLEDFWHFDEGRWLTTAEVARRGIYPDSL